MLTLFAALGRTQLKTVAVKVFPIHGLNLLGSMEFTNVWISAVLMQKTQLLMNSKMEHAYRARSIH